MGQFSIVYQTPFDNLSLAANQFRDAFLLDIDWYYMIVNQRYLGNSNLQK